MAEIVRSGSASITVNQDNLRRLLDRTTDGAASNFIREADTALAEVQRNAMARWPVASGKSLRSFERRTDIGEKKIAVALLNTATNNGFPYPRFIKFSVYTEATVKRNLAERDEFVSRGTSQEARKALGDLWDKTRRLTSSKGSPDERSAGKRAWNRLVRTPGRSRGQAMIDAVRDDLARLARGA
jgi:hypothetical protein